MALEGVDESFKTSVRKSIRDMLHPQSSLRPSATKLFQHFLQYYLSALALGNAISQTLAMKDLKQTSHELPPGMSPEMMGADLL